MEILYQDRDCVVCVKPAGVLSTDEPGGLPELLREALHVRDIRTVHRLDRVVSGLMVLARNADAASELSRQIREGGFDKRYLAVVHGRTEPRGTMRDLLARDKTERKTYVAAGPGKGVQEAVLHYETLGWTDGKELCRNKLCKDSAGFFARSEAEKRRNTLCISSFDNDATGEKDKLECTSYFGTVPKSLVRIELVTGRTHQIRCQFSHRGLPLVGDRKYSLLDDGCDIALWSSELRFQHPKTGEEMHLKALPPAVWPWTEFEK